jgi:hypothetical protein
MVQMSDAEKSKLPQGLSFFDQCALPTLFSSYAQSKGVSCSEVKMLQMSMTALWKVSAAKKIIFYIVCLITVGIWYIAHYVAAMRDFSDGKHALSTYFSSFIARNALSATMPQHMRADAMKISSLACVNAGITDPKNLALMERVRNGQFTQSQHNSSYGINSVMGVVFGPALTGLPSSSGSFPPTVNVSALNATTPTAENPTPTAENPASLEVQKRRKMKRLDATKHGNFAVPLGASGLPVADPEKHKLSYEHADNVHAVITDSESWKVGDVPVDKIPQTVLAYALLAEFSGMVSAYNGVVTDIGNTRPDIDDAAKNVSSAHRSLLTALEAAEDEKRNRLKSLDITMLPRDIIDCFNLQRKIGFCNDLHLPLTWTDDVPHAGCDFSNSIEEMLRLGIAEEFISSRVERSTYLGKICTNVQLDESLNRVVTVVALMSLLKEVLLNYMNTFDSDDALSLPADMKGEGVASLFGDLKKQQKAPPSSENYFAPGEFPRKLSELHAAFEKICWQQKIDASAGIGGAGGLGRGEPPPARKSNDEISREALACFLGVLSEVVSNEGAIAENVKEPAVAAEREFFTELRRDFREFLKCKDLNARALKLHRRFTGFRCDEARRLQKLFIGDNRCALAAASAQKSFDKALAKYDELVAELNYHEGERERIRSRAREHRARIMDAVKNSGGTVPIDCYSEVGNDFGMLFPHFRMHNGRTVLGLNYGWSASYWRTACTLDPGWTVPAVPRQAKA